MKQTRYALNEDKFTAPQKLRRGTGPIFGAKTQENENGLLKNAKKFDTPEAIKKVQRNITNPTLAQLQAAASQQDYLEFSPIPDQQDLKLNLPQKGPIKVYKRVQCLKTQTSGLTTGRESLMDAIWETQIDKSQLVNSALQNVSISNDLMGVQKENVVKKRQNSAVKKTTVKPHVINLNSSTVFGQNDQSKPDEKRFEGVLRIKREMIR